MKFLNHFWPWKELNRLNEEVEFLKRTLEHEQTSHNITRASLQDHKLELIDHKSRNAQSQKDIRKLATILAVRGGITLILLFFAFSAVGQPLQRNPVTTNLLGNAASVSYFLGWDGSKPAWGVPPDGLGTNSWLTNASFIFPIPHLAASNDLGWWNAGGDVSANATNNDKLFGLNATNEVARMGTSITNGAILNLSNLVSTISQNATNQGTVVSNGVVAHTVTVAGTANQITSSVGTAQTIAANPATTLSLPDPLIAPGVFSANGQTNRAFAAIGVVTNDANGKLYTTPILDSALVNFTPATNQSTVVSNGLAPRMVFSLQSYMILASTVSANQTNFFAIHGTTSKSTAETSAKEIYLTGGAAAGHGGWVSNFWVYFNSSIGSSTNLFFYLITNGVATGMGMNYTGNGSGNRVAADNTHPFFIATSSDWSIGMTNNNNLPSSLVFSWGIDVYPQ